MVKIIKGTTPTIEFVFHIVAVNQISVAVLTIKQGGNIVIEKDKTQAIIGAESLSWKLTQAESLLLGKGEGTLMCNWKLLDGTRGASDEDKVLIVDNHKNEVI